MAIWCGARMTGGRAPPAGAGWSKTPAARSASRIEQVGAWHRLD
jgi:hypothetical protein